MNFYHIESATTESSSVAKIQHTVANYYLTRFKVQLPFD